MEAVFLENCVTWVKVGFPKEAYSSESKILRIDSFWQKDEEIKSCQRETILLVRESEFYEVL